MSEAHPKNEHVYVSYSGGCETASATQEPETAFTFNRIIRGDTRYVLRTLPSGSVDLSFWSPPYFVGKSYERGWSFEEWQRLLEAVVREHQRILKPGGFLAVNIGDILCYPDPDMPRFQADNVSRKKVPVTREQILAVLDQRPKLTRYQLAEVMGCSEQTIQRRLETNNVRGGKHAVSTKVKLTGGLLSDWAAAAGLYLYDRRIWHKDPCWANSRWHSNSYRAVDEFEYVYVFWRPGITTYDRNRIEQGEWAEWGSRGVWHIPSVSRNDRHEAEFPELLAERVIRLFSAADGVVLDPFVGSGTTTCVAKRWGRKWLGIDSDPQAVETSLDRMHDVF